MTCRQCPGYKKDFSSAPWICGSASETQPTPGDGPSTSSNTCTGNETGLHSGVTDSHELMKAEVWLHLISQSQFSVKFFEFIYFISELAIWGDVTWSGSWLAWTFIWTFALSHSFTLILETQEFTCPPHGSHLVCTCCLQSMPDRRAEHIGPNPSPQHCECHTNLSIKHKHTNLQHLCWTCVVY